MGNHIFLQHFSQNYHLPICCIDFNISVPIFSQLECKKQEGHHGPVYDRTVSLHWPITKITSYQTLQNLGIGFKK